MASAPFEPDSLVLDGRFRVLRRLGAGGMGEVYLAEQVSLHRKVALKALRQDLYHQPGMAERFRREALLLSSVDHPSVVRVIDFGESQGAPCLVMELVEGDSLDVALARGPFPPERALPLLEQLAEGLAAIHDKGIVHRDLKPDNVILATGPRGEQARLLDFGIARLAEPDPASGVTQAGFVLGTPEYLSPEQAMGLALDGRSDLYSFGVLAFRLLSGELPFKGPSPREFLAQHATVLPARLEQVAPRLRDHPALCALVMRCLEKDASRRPASARELAHALGAPALRRPSAPAAEVPPSPSPPLQASWGTQLFAAAPPPAPSRTAAFGAPSSSTQAFGAPPSSSSPAAALPPSPAVQSPVPPGPTTAALMARPSGEHRRTSFTGSLAIKAQNLTVMLTDIQGFTERTSRQTREQNARMMREHDRLLLPIIRAFTGRIQERRGDALLIVFKSPTESVLCGMALQDALWRHNLLQPELERIPVRIAIHLGEVLAMKSKLVGEPVQIVSAVEEAAGVGEVVLTEAVRLSMNRAEAPTEEKGAIQVPGRDEQLRIYRCIPAAEGPPFGGRDLRIKGSILADPDALRQAAGRTLTRAMARSRGGLTAARARGRALLSRLPKPGRREAFAGIALLLLGMLAALTLTVRYNAPPRKARRQLQAGRYRDALETVEAACLTLCSTELRSLQAAAKHELDSHQEELALLNGLDPTELSRLDPLTLASLAEDFGRNERNSAVRALLSRLPAEGLERLASEPGSLAQWGALRYLESAKAIGGPELPRLYANALGANECWVRAAAVRRLVELGDPSARPALAKLATLPRKRSGESCGQDEASSALRKLGQP